MYIFLDESGTHKQEGKSSIALVYLSIEDMEIFQQLIIDIEKRINITNFHWTECPWPVREKFINAVAKLPMTIKVALIKNPFYATRAYEYALSLLVTEKNIHTVIIDGKKDKQYERKIKKIMRDKNISIKKLRAGNDESYPALRVADAIAGLVRYRYEHMNDARVKNMYRRIAKKILITIEQ